MSPWTLLYGNLDLFSIPILVTAPPSVHSLRQYRAYISTTFNKNKLVVHSEKQEYHVLLFVDIMISKLENQSISNYNLVSK